MLGFPFLRSLCLSATLAILLCGSAVAQESDDAPLPLSASLSSSAYAESLYPKPLSFAQQQARFQAEQRMMRMEANKWIGYEPLRPTVSAGYIYHNRYVAYSPYRGRFNNNGWGASTWFW